LHQPLFFTSAKSIENVEQTMLATVKLVNQKKQGMLFLLLISC
jgi:hypothetical protein